MKTKTAVLNGKPDAGNPHVRFDEGEVASAKPRRGSLHYKKSYVGAGVLGVGLCLSAFGYEDQYLTTDAQGVVMRETEATVTYVITNTAEGLSFRLKSAALLDTVMLVGGGGAGGSYPMDGRSGSGGGGGGVLLTNILAACAADCDYSYVIGVGGAADCQKGDDTSLTLPNGTITAYGGGGGQGRYLDSTDTTSPCGSTGGGALQRAAATNYTTGQGNPGGVSHVPQSGAGGGGAGEKGFDSNNSVAPAQGGRGFETDLSGETHVYGSGGGGGNATATSSVFTPALGGEESGGASACPGVDGLGGGGGGGWRVSSWTPISSPGRGGSGALVMRFVRGTYTKAFDAALSRENWLQTGAATCPKPVVKDPDTGDVLVEGTHYEVIYVNNEQPGHAMLAVRGKGDYADCAALLDFQVLAIAYEDDYIATSDASAIPHEAPAEVSYSFTNAIGDVILRLKEPRILVDCLIVGGGGAGGGGASNGGYRGGGGGGGGGVVYREVKAEIGTDSDLVVQIGAGGIASAHHGGDSFLKITNETICAYGGGGGRTWNMSTLPDDRVCGSSGGGSYTQNGRDNFTAEQGHRGGLSETFYGGGGGGATQDGCSATDVLNPGGGGCGFVSNISGERHVYGSGGGAGAAKVNNVAVVAAGGEESGGASGCPGADGLGGGGGGGSAAAGQNQYFSVAANGGTGAVVLRFSKLKAKGFFDAALSRDWYLQTGSTVCPKPVVKDPDTGDVLVEGTHYKLEYVDNVELGNASMIVTGLGPDYDGYVASAAFRVVPSVERDILWTSDSSVDFRTNKWMCSVVFTNVTDDFAFVLKKGIYLLDALVVGGGGAGQVGSRPSGGGGAGGLIYRQVGATYPAVDSLVRVGKGGDCVASTAGSSSILELNGEMLEAYGGQGGATGTDGSASKPGPYGSAGGSAAAGLRYTAIYTPGQGNPGGLTTDYGKPGGGGGATEAGHSPNAALGPAQGGNGYASAISGEYHVYASGGAGAIAGAVGGLESGGSVGQSGVDGLGGGGGGALVNGSPGLGGSGSVVLRFVTAPFGRLLEGHLSRTNYLASGSAICPKPVVIDPENGTTLVEGDDYDLEYDKNVAPGVAVVAAVGKGAYANCLALVDYVILAPAYEDMCIRTTDGTVNVVETDMLRIYTFTNSTRYLEQIVCSKGTCFLRDVFLVGGGSSTAIDVTAAGKDLPANVAYQRVRQKLRPEDECFLRAGLKVEQKASVLKLPWGTLESPAQTGGSLPGMVVLRFRKGGFAVIVR